MHNLTFNLSALESDPITYISNLSDSDLDNIIKELSEIYYNTDKPLVSDEIFDILLNTMKERSKNYSHLENQIAPIWMGSMNKIKQDCNELDKWKEKYKGNYVISNKLDGISGLLVYNNEKISLYTRGKNISHLVKYLNIPEYKTDIIVRGELVISKENFILFKDKFSNERNIVSGVVNSKKIDIDILKYIDFVTYQGLRPDIECNPEDELKILYDYGFKVVRYKLLNNINNEILSEELLKERNESAYLIDGIIVMDNNYYPLITSGNPKHAFAYKMVLNDQKAESVVKDILWEPSKTGYLKPRIQIEPVILQTENNSKGVKIEYITGNNAKFIIDNKIGVGSLIELVRSGDVIPKVTKILKDSIPKMPSESYHWNETEVDIILDNYEQNKTVLLKQIHTFFKVLDIKNISIGIYTKLYDNGYNTIKDLLDIKIEDLLQLKGIKKILANKIYNEIQKTKSNMNLVNLMIASGKFGRGFGKSRIELILSKNPDIINIYYNKPEIEVINIINQIPGFQKKTSSQFVINMENFLSFLKEINIELSDLKSNEIEPIKSNILNEKNKNLEQKSNEIPIKLFNEKKILFTGFRNKELETFIKINGGKTINNISKDLFLLIIKNENTKSKKIDECKKLKISIITLTDFINKYMKN